MNTVRSLVELETSPDSADLEYEGLNTPSGNRVIRPKLEAVKRSSSVISARSFTDIEHDAKLRRSGLGGSADLSAREHIATEGWDLIPVLEDVPSLSKFRLFFTVLGMYNVNTAINLLVYIVLALPLMVSVMLLFTGELDAYVSVLFFLAFSFGIVSKYIVTRYIKSGLLSKLLFMASEGVFGQKSLKQSVSGVHLASVEALTSQYFRTTITASILFFTAWTSLMVVAIVLFDTNSTWWYSLYLKLRIFIEGFAILVYIGNSGLFNYVLRLHSIAVDNYTQLISKLHTISDSDNLHSKVGGRDSEKLATLMTEHEVLSRDLKELSAAMAFFWFFSFTVFAIGVVIGLYLLVLRGVLVVDLFVDRAMVIAFSLASIFGLINVLHAPLSVSNAYERLKDVANSSHMWDTLLTLRFVQYLNAKPSSFTAYGINVDTALVAKSLYILGTIMVLLVRLGV